MPENRDSDHLLQIFLSSVRVFRDKPFIYEKHAKMFVSSLRKEAAFEINSLSRALHSIHVELDSRVALCGLPPSKAFWSLEWAALSIKATSVIIPESFPLSERIDVLAETHSKVAVVRTQPEAAALAAEQARLPDLTHIICLEGKNIPAPKKDFTIKLEKSLVPIVTMSYNDFFQSGRNFPDRTAEVLSKISPSDTAILFYSQKQGKIHKVERYTHAQLQDHARVMERLLGSTHTINETDIVLTSPSWDHPIEHIASCYLPILRDAAIQINDEATDFTCFENHPNIVVAEAAYLDNLKRHIEQYIQNSGWLEWRMFQKALEYGKRKYEKGHKIGLRRKLFDYVLNKTVIHKVVALLGGRLRLIIGIDDAASYETQLFFHSFGVDLVELPSEIFAAE